MKIIPPKIPFVTFFLVLSFCTLLVSPVWADLLDKGKSDSTIKMLVFPKSLRVIENREKGEIDHDDIKQNNKALLKVDPARVVPAKIGEPLKREITRDLLKQLSKKYSEDVLFIFRRKMGNEENVIHHQGLLYLTKQKKILALKESMPSGSGSLKERDLAGLKALAREAKRILHANKFEKRQSAY